MQVGCSQTTRHVSLRHQQIERIAQVVVIRVVAVRLLSYKRASEDSVCVRDRRVHDSETRVAAVEELRCLSPTIVHASHSSLAVQHHTAHHVVAAHLLIGREPQRNVVVVQVVDLCRLIARIS